MAIPLTNAKLSEMGADVNRSLPVSLRDIALSRRALDFNNSESTSTADLRGSITSVQEYVGQYGTANNPTKGNPQLDWCHRKDMQSANLLQRPDCTQDANTGHLKLSFLWMGGSANQVGIQVNCYGKLPASGQFAVEVNHSSGHGQWRRRIEIVGSKSGWLQGSANIYAYSDDNKNTPIIFNPVDIDPDYPYLTVTCLTYVKSTNNSYNVRTEFGDIKAYLL